MKSVYFALVAASVVVACGTRVSLGNLPEDDPTTTTDGTQPAPSASNPVKPAPSPAEDAGSPIDAGPAPGDDASDQDGGKAPYLPCAGKACGASCTVCDPTDINCFETAVIKQCDKTGACVAAPSSC